MCLSLSGGLNYLQTHSAVTLAAWENCCRFGAVNITDWLEDYRWVTEPHLVVNFVKKKHRNNEIDTCLTNNLHLKHEYWMTGNVSLAFLKAYLLQKVNMLALGTTERLHLHLN